MKEGIHPDYHKVLFVDSATGHEWISRSTLERLQLRHHSAVGLVDRLVAERLIVRRRSAEDGRQVNVLLTARGEAILEKLSATHREQLRRIGAEIGTLLERLGTESRNTR